MAHNTLFVPTEDQVGRPVFYTRNPPDFLTDVLHAKLLGIISPTVSRIAFFYPNSDEVSGDELVVENTSLMWAYKVHRHQRDELGSSTGFSITLIRPNRIIDRDEMMDTARRLVGKVHDPDSGDPYTVEQIADGLWAWFNLHLDNLLADLDWYPFNDAHDSRIFFRALDSIGEADPRRVPEDEPVQAAATVETEATAVLETPAPDESEAVL